MSKRSIFLMLIAASILAYLPASAHGPRSGMNIDSAHVDEAETISGAWDFTDVGTVDFAGGLTAASFGSDPKSNPKLALEDSDAPGTDKVVGGISSQYVDGADGSENADTCLEFKQGGVDGVDALCVDESDDAVEVYRVLLAPVHVKPITDATYTVGTDSSHEIYGGLFINNDDDVLTVTLTSAVTGMHACFANGDGVTAVYTIDCDGGDEFVVTGVGGGNGNAIASAGAAGDYVCVTAISAAQWLVDDRNGTWGVP